MRLKIHSYSLKMRLKWVIVRESDKGRALQVFNKRMIERTMNAQAGTIDLALSPPQQEVIRGGLLSSGFSCVLQMPTGSGKTWLAERAIEETIVRGQRAIYLTPLRALAAEL